MKAVVVYGGRFQPFHKGHKSSYDFLVKRFGADSVYVASAEKPPGEKDPFTFEEKKKIAVFHGIPENKFVKIAHVYSKIKIQESIPFDANNTVLILAVSLKDRDRFAPHVDKDGYSHNKNGERAAIQRLRKNPEAVASGEYYVVPTPTLEFNIIGQPVTGATQIRKLYASANGARRQEILKDLYGTVSPRLKQLFDTRIKAMQTESLLREFVEFINKF